jgi:hypothetical protein
MLRNVIGGQESTRGDWKRRGGKSDLDMLQREAENTSG